MEERVIVKIQQFRTAVSDFSLSLDLPLDGLSETMVDTLKNGHVQKFEICVELLWKTLKGFIAEIHGFEEASPKKVLKKFYELGYVNGSRYERLMRLIDIRNSMSHIYDKNEFFRAYEIVKNSLHDFQTVIAAVEKERGGI